MNRFQTWIRKNKKISTSEVNRKFSFAIVLFTFLGVYLKYIDEGFTITNHSFIYIFSAVFTGFMIICYSLFQFYHKRLEKDKTSWIIAKALDWFTLLVGFSVVLAPFLFVDGPGWLIDAVVYVVTLTVILPVAIIFLAFILTPKK